MPRNARIRLSGAPEGDSVDTPYTFRIGDYVTEHPQGIPAPWNGTIVEGEGERLVREVARRLAKVRSSPHHRPRRARTLA
jgi:radical SAM superfamily enzyme YgiQ (UPF0313 family)